MWLQEVLHCLPARIDIDGGFHHYVLELLLVLFFKHLFWDLLKIELMSLSLGKYIFFLANAWNCKGCGRWSDVDVYYQVDRLRVIVAKFYLSDDSQTYEDLRDVVSRERELDY